MEKKRFGWAWAGGVIYSTRLGTLAAHVTQTPCSVSGNFSPANGGARMGRLMQE